MFEIYFLFIISLIGFIDGLRRLKEKRNTRKFYDGMSYLIYGAFGLLASITVFILGYSNWSSLYIFLPMLLFGGGYGLFFKNKIKNGIFYRIDFFTFIIGIMLLIDFILYLFGYFPFQN